jgi:hypothetical protein
MSTYGWAFGRTCWPQASAGRTSTGLVRSLQLLFRADIAKDAFFARAGRLTASSQRQ